jgi:hypothetical protein
MNKLPNKLINEKSPYLLQHAYNPVNWYPWGEEAFNIAKLENKPIFLSIGYSTCHWCHVMAHESFENELIADYLNKHFVSIKLDREEYPEIDNIYMHVCQMVNGNGGWPLSVFMDYTQKPFFVNTYFPPEDRYGRIGFLTLLKRINEYWINEPDKIAASINALSETLNFTYLKNDVIAFNEDTFHQLFNALSNSFDINYGGFGSAPKFPTPQNYLFLLNFAHFFNSTKALDIVEKSLSNMRLGGIFDQVGFGFHRYSTDRFWLLPHFEKMLYDQAMLILAYSNTYRATKNNFYKNTAYEIITFLERELLSPAGGFYSAIDADSEGEEGKFYLWSYNELKNLIPKNLFDDFCKYYNVEKEGNYFDERTKTKTGGNILHVTSYDKEKEFAFKPILDNLYKIRAKRIHPIIDTKILIDWNGLIIWALSEAGIIFKDRKLIDIAENTFNFILSNLITKNNKLLHRYIDGECGLEATADDYAFLINGSLSLFKATTNIKYFEHALKLNEVFINDFWDEENFGFYFSSKEGEKLISRSKQLFDNAIPSSNSIAAFNLLQLYSITGDSKFINYFENLLKAYNSDTIKFTRSLSMLINIFLQYYIGFTEILIFENNNPEKAKLFLEFIYSNFTKPYTLTYVDNTNIDILVKYAPYLYDYKTKTDDAYIYICQNGTCNLPTNNLEELKSFILE